MHGPAHKTFVQVY